MTHVGDHLRVTDARDLAAFEVSWSPLGAAPGAPSARGRVEHVLASAEAANPSIDTYDRGDIDVAWADYLGDADDGHGGPRRPAHHRLLIAVGEHGQLLITFAHWPEDAAWATAEWHNVIATLRVD